MAEFSWSYSSQPNDSPSPWLNHLYAVLSHFQYFPPDLQNYPEAFLPHAK